MMVVYSKSIADALKEKGCAPKREYKVGTLDCYEFEGPQLHKALETIKAEYESRTSTIAEARKQLEELKSQ